MDEDNNQSQKKYLKEVLESAIDNASELNLSVSGNLDDVNQLRNIIATKIYEKLINKCLRGDPDKDNQYSNMFEEICFNIIKATFSDEFPNTLPIRHPAKRHIFGENSKFRDIVIENKGRLDKKSIWGLIGDKESTNCATIVFECKNYEKSKITSKEIFQLYGYLNPNGFGKFGVILCRDKNKTVTTDAYTAVKRVWRDGYVIIILDDLEIKEWLEYWSVNKEIEGFFSKKFTESKPTVSE